MPPSGASGVESCTVSPSLPIPACNRQNMQPTPPPNVSSSAAPQVGQVEICCFAATSDLACSSSASRLRPLFRRQPGQPPSGASAGISAPHFGQILTTLIIIGDSLAPPLFYCVKFYQRLRLDCSN